MNRWLAVRVLALLCAASPVALRPLAAVETAEGRDRSPEPQPPATGGGVDAHAAFGRLLDRYVEEGRVDYAGWRSSPSDRARLSAYVDSLEANPPEVRARAESLAYWIDLYNAATLELVLAHPALASIREVGGPEGSPWKRNVVAVGGDSLSLDGIENGIIRARFGDPRTHFALSCAALGCPPLQRTPFIGSTLEADLDRVTREALNDPRWVAIEGDRLLLSLIFEWYEADFIAAAGSVEAFLARYRSDVSADRAGARERVHIGYDWAINAR